MQPNPFPKSSYISKEYFCNREYEVKQLLAHIANGNNITLVAPRRMGKTGLILRTFEELRDQERFPSVYVDILPTRSLSDFIKMLSEAILAQFSEKTSFGEKFWNFIKGLRPLIGFDNITGAPQVLIQYQHEQQKEQTLHSLLDFIEEHAPIVIAIDEFQQISEYPEKNVEALLRSRIQFMKKTRFIFSGSKRSVMLDMFSNVKRPFYASTNFMNLDKIEQDEYAAFITHLFTTNKFKIKKDVVKFILEWTETYTYYTQSLCNKVYALGKKHITLEVVKQACTELLSENETQYLQIKRLLTDAQWNYLIAIAKEYAVEKITAQKFLLKHKIGTAANSSRLSKSLCEKELILEQTTRKGNSFRIYDVFFAHWLREVY